MAGYQYEHLGFHFITLFNPSRTLWAPCRYELEDNALSREHNHYRVSELMAQPVRASALGPDEPVTDSLCDWSAAESVSWHLASQLSPQFIRKQEQCRRRKTPQNLLSHYQNRRTMDIALDFQRFKDNCKYFIVGTIYCIHRQLFRLSDLRIL